MKFVVNLQKMSDLEPNFDFSDNGYPVKEPVSYFALSLQRPNKIRLINVGPELVRCIQERLEQLIPVETFGYVIFKDYMQVREHKDLFDSLPI